MKTSIALAIAIIICAISVVPVHAADSTKKASAYDTYTCDELTTLDFQSVGPVVYYVAGHYDAKHDIWTDYGYKSKTVTADTGNVVIPVEDVYAYCLKNPKDTVVSALTKQKH
jgi:hypothetical protein